VSKCWYIHKLRDTYVIAAEIVRDLQDALDEFALIAEDLRKA
jgi:hypothetical protein